VPRTLSPRLTRLCRLQAERPGPARLKGLENLNECGIFWEEGAISGTFPVRVQSEGFLIWTRVGAVLKARTIPLGLRLVEDLFCGCNLTILVNRAVCGRLLTPWCRNCEIMADLRSEVAPPIDDYSH
jgi:hypothetical protein